MKRKRSSNLRKVVNDVVKQPNLLESEYKELLALIEERLQDAHLPCSIKACLRSARRQLRRLLPRIALEAISVMENALTQAENRLAPTKYKKKKPAYEVWRAVTRNLQLAEEKLEELQRFAEASPLVLQEVLGEELLSTHFLGKTDARINRLRQEIISLERKIVNRNTRSRPRKEKLRENLAKLTEMLKDKGNL